MVDIEEVKKILIQEEVKAIYDSIDTKELDKKEEQSIFWDNYIKKDDHPISFQVDREIEEWEQSAPLFKELRNIEMGILGLTFAYLGMWLLIGLFVIVYAIVSY